jgi:hypothetical protein
MHKIFLASALAASLGGCAVFTAIENMTPTQQATLATEVINGVCTVSVVGISGALAIDNVVAPNAATGGKGQSVLGTLTKVSQIDALTCASLSGLPAALNGTTATVLAAH